MKSLIWAVVLILGLALQGCSAFKANTQPVYFTCAQPAAMIMVNGERRACPSILELPRNREFTIEARGDGLAPSIRTVGYHFGTAGKWDVVGTVVWGVPAIGLLFPGAWDLDQTAVSVELFPTVN